MSTPIICFGQQPCGFFPRRFLVSKIQTARKLQAEIGGEIVFFYHDSDHDYRETQTTLRDHKTNQPITLNFTFANKLQRKYSPLYTKRVLPAWRDHTARQLPAFVDAHWATIFKNIAAENVADFCLEFYRALGLLEGIHVVRSSEKSFRAAACEISDCFVDVLYETEIVRARWMDKQLKLHEGGDVYKILPNQAFQKEQISPTRDSRLRWMQSVIACTHYIAGLGETNYLKTEDAPEIVFRQRAPIERSDEAYVEFPH